MMIAQKNLFLNKVLGNAGLDIELSEIPDISMKTQLLIRKRLNG